LQEINNQQDMTNKHLKATDKQQEIAGVKFGMYPYVHMDSGPSFSNDQISYIWQQMERDQTWQKVFYDGSVQSEGDFLQFLQRDDIRFFLLSNDDIAGGFIWLSPMATYSSWIHFCCFSNSWGKSGFARPMLKWALQSVLDMKGPDGKNIISTLMGLTPADNKLACQFAFDVGMQVVGIAPGAIYNNRTDMHVPGLITYINKAVN